MPCGVSRTISAALSSGPGHGLCPPRPRRGCLTRSFLSGIKTRLSMLLTHQDAGFWLRGASGPGIRPAGKRLPALPRPGKATILNFPTIFNPGRAMPRLFQEQQT